jgi:hypothetical protein
MILKPNKKYKKEWLNIERRKKGKTDQRLKKNSRKK